MVHIPEQEEITEKPTGSIDTAATADTAKPPDNALKSYVRKGAKRKYNTRRADPIKSAIPKFTGRCTDLYGFIYDLGPNQTDEYIKTKLEIEEYAGKTYETEVRKPINELEIKVSAFIKPEDLTTDKKLSLMHTESYTLEIRQWLNRRKTYKQSMRVIYSIVYVQCNVKMKQRLETFPAFASIKEKDDHKSYILLLDTIKRICCNFEAEKNKVLEAIQTQKKTMRWRKSLRVNTCGV